MAQPIKPDSWLQGDDYREFRAFYSYVRNKTNAIPACAACSPEDLYFIVSFLDHWQSGCVMVRSRRHETR